MSSRGGGRGGLTPILIGAHFVPFSEGTFSAGRNFFGLFCSS